MRHACRTDANQTDEIERLHGILRAVLRHALDIRARTDPPDDDFYDATAIVTLVDDELGTAGLSSEWEWAE